MTQNGYMICKCILTMGLLFSIFAYYSFVSLSIFIFAKLFLSKLINTFSAPI